MRALQASYPLGIFISLINWGACYLIKSTCNICFENQKYILSEQIYHHLNYQINDWSDLSLCSFIPLQIDITDVTTNHPSRIGVRNIMHMFYITGPHRIMLVYYWLNIVNKTCVLKLLNKSIKIIVFYNDAYL